MQTQHSDHLESWKLFVVIGSLCLAIFLHGLDTNIIGVAMPEITTEFNSLNDIAWYGSSYLLTVTAFQPLFGNLYKYFRAKPVYLASIFTFEVGSVICAAAPTSAVLILGRSILGLGAAGLLQGALAIIGYAVKLEKVPQYQGIVISAFGISVCTGPIIGGSLTDRTSWRWCFWINVPAGFLVIVLILVFVRIQPKADQVNQNLPLSKKLAHLDAFGTILFIAGICCLLIALQLGGNTIPWKSSKSIGLLVGFAALIATFSLLQWHRGEYATIPPRIIAKRSIYTGALVLFFLGMSSLTYTYYLPIFFQSIQGVSATHSGVRFIALVVPQIVLLVVTGAIVSKVGYYVPFILLGITIDCIGAGLITTLGVETPNIRWAAFLVVNGIGIGMAQQLPYTALQAVLDPLDVATGNAIAVFSFQLGGALGIAIAQNLFLTKLANAVANTTADVSPQAVINAGAMGLPMLAKSSAMLFTLREAYAEAIRYTFILALVAACAAFPWALGMEWLNIRKIAEARRAEAVERASNAIGPEAEDKTACGGPRAVENSRDAPIEME
ncbi:MFS general substrate transporter [Karstenula rhodostoma CBS 690.94]|uniref:MFS general substrate transporter n=1 Tax=Karstenula rhodostoma CBS 690.94 TaxID=1392251 RepID=A0A9P4UB91_9PLEO|nr:MFS general substrate transporter [Karstenula rhodostoma CBS 690.94]